MLVKLTPGHPRSPWSSSRRCRPRRLLRTSWTSCRGITASWKSNDSTTSPFLTTFFNDVSRRSLRTSHARIQINVCHGVTTVSHTHTLMLLLYFYDCSNNFCNEKMYQQNFMTLTKTTLFIFLLWKTFLSKWRTRNFFGETFFWLFLFFMRLF